MENIFVEFLPPWVETGMQPAFYDKESGTVLQQTARMYARVNMLIRMFNKLSKQTKTTVDDYISKFNTLYNYVHDYFDNLDVQEEINNKLDEMADDGTLADIVAEYLRLRGVLGYQNVAGLKNADNVVDGSLVETYGYYSAGDEGGAKYTIRTATVDDTPDDKKIIAITGTTLVAELINQEEVNVKQLGAYGDGTHDDTDTFKYAIANFTKINVPLGQYVITDTLFIPENKVIEGVANNSFFNGYEYGSTLIYQSETLEDPCISFLGRDTGGNNHKEIYIIAGSQLDNGTYTQTVSAKLTKINIVSEDDHTLGVAFAGCPESELQVRCYGFVAGIASSACWGSNIHDCFCYCSYGIICGSDNNGVSLSHSYFDCSDNTVTIDASSRLYSVVTGDKYYNDQKNKPCGVLTYFVNNLIMHDVISEHFKIGYIFGASSRIKASGVYGESNDNFCATYTGNIELDGIYAYMSASNNKTAFLYNTTKLQISNAFCQYDHFLDEISSPTNRYGNYYILENISGKNIINYFNSDNADVIYYKSDSTFNEGLPGSECNNIDTAIKLVKDGGTIVLKSNLILSAGSPYREIKKSITFTSDDTTRTVSNDTTLNSIYPTRFYKDLTFKNVNITVSTQTTPSDVSLSSLLNPYTVNKKTLRIENSTIDTSSYNGVLNADWNRNTLCDVDLYQVTFTGGEILTTNHSGGSSKKLNINLYKQEVTGTPVLGTQTTTVLDYSN